MRGSDRSQRRHPAACRTSAATVPGKSALTSSLVDEALGRNALQLCAAVGLCPFSVVAIALPRANDRSSRICSFAGRFYYAA